MHAAYDAIYFELKRLIEEGVYPYRSFLPSEAALVKHFGCAHNTVRKALGILAADGYLQPVHGKGVRVLYNPPYESNRYPATFCTTRIQSFAETGERQGFVASTKVLCMEPVVVNEEIANLTHFNQGEDLLHIQRIRYYDGVPRSFEKSYYRSDIVEGITKEDAERSLYAYIEKVNGVKLVTCKRLVTIERATELDRELLNLNDVTHVAVVRAIVFDGFGLMCESTETRQHPEVFSLEQVAVQSRTNG